MQVFNIEKRSYRIRKIYHTLIPLNWILQIFALNSCKRNNAKKHCFLIKKIALAALVGSLNFFSFRYKILYIYREINVSIVFTNVVQTILDFCQYIVDLYFVNKYGREDSLQYYQKYENIDDILLDVTYYSNIKRRLMKLVGFFIFIWMTSSVCDLAAWYMSFGMMTPIVFSIAYVFLLTKILTTTDLASQVIHIECRLRVMGNIMQDFYNSTDELPASISISITDSVFKKGKIYNARSQPLTLHTIAKNPYLLKSMSHRHESKRLSRCYLLLCEQCAFVNKMFGIRILLISLSLLIDMVRFTNIVIRVVLGTQHTTYNSGYFLAVSNVLRMLTSAAVLPILVYHCELVYRQSNRIIDIIDHLLINKNPSDDLRAAGTELRGLIASRPISFDMANFFRLDNKLLISIASVVVTYIIILVQNIN